MRAGAAFSHVRFDANGKSSTRNRSACVPEENGGYGGQKHARARTPSLPSPALAASYAEKLGITLGTDGWLDRAEQLTIKGRKTWVRSWGATRYPVSVNTLRRSLTGEWGLALAGQATVRHLLIDVDVHGVNGEPGDTEPVHIDEWIAGRRSHRRRRRVRERVAAVAAPIIAKLRELLPDVPWVMLGTRRGVHMLALLDEPLPVAEAAALGTALLAAIGSPPSVEARPITECGGRTARLPLTAGSRLLSADLVAYKHRRRIDDVRELVAAETASVGSFALVLHNDRAETPLATAEQQVKRAPSGPGATSSRAPSAARVSELQGDAELRERLNRQLTGEEFVSALLDAFEAGMPDDSSYASAGKLAAAVTYVGLSIADAELAGWKWIELPHHRATHAADEQGQRAWMRTYRACLRHQHRGVACGKVKPGRLTDPRLWGMFERLLGRRPGRAQASEVTKTKRREAARVRWAKRTGVGANGAA